MSAGRILFIVNPVAGGGKAREAWGGLQKRIARANLNCERRFTSGPGDAREIAEDATEKFDTLAAAGGDGTASEVADGILRSSRPQTTLAIFPLGAGNDAARALGLNSADDAFAALRAGRKRTMDAISITCRIDGKQAMRHAIIFAALGITSEIAKQTSPGVKRFLGARLAYRYGVLKALWNYRAPQMRVDCDGVSHEGRFLLACASNTEKAGGGIPLAPGALMNDGFLDVNLVQAVSRWQAFRQFLRLCRGRHITHPRVQFRRAKSLAIESATPLEVAADGDLIGHTPARFEIAPQILRVIA